MSPGKEDLIHYLIDSCVAELILCDDEDLLEGEREVQIVDEFISDINVALTDSYSIPFEPGSFLSSKEPWVKVLPNLDEEGFKQLVRVNRIQFDVILQEIKDDPLFTRHSAKQFSVEYQLFLCLYRLGSCGEGASVAKIARFFGCGDGGTINNITERVLRAILNKNNEYISWPNENERREIITNTFHELPHCLGYLDGIEIPLAEKPLIDPHSYISSNQQYTLKGLAVCDYRLRFRYIVMGYPGSVDDSRIYNDSSLCIREHKFFSGMQYVAADSAYELRNTVMTPFNEEEHITYRQKTFNGVFSKYRVRIERAVGILKERFSSLNELKIKVRNTKSVQYACRWFNVCCVLHNMLVNPADEATFEYQPEVENGFANDVSKTDLPLEEDEKDGVAAMKRRALLQLI